MEIVPGLRGHIVYRWYLVEDKATSKGEVIIGGMHHSERAFMKGTRRTIPIMVDEDMNITLIRDMEERAYPRHVGIIVGTYKHVGRGIKYEIADEAWDWFKEYGN
jgi:hypothetical protein